MSIDAGVSSGSGAGLAYPAKRHGAIAKRCRVVVAHDDRVSRRAVALHNRLLVACNGDHPRNTPGSNRLIAHDEVAVASERHHQGAALNSAFDVDRYATGARVEAGCIGN